VTSVEKLENVSIEVDTDSETGNATVQLSTDTDEELPENIQVTVGGKVIDPKFYSYNRETGAIVFNIPLDDDADIEIYSVVETPATEETTTTSSKDDTTTTAITTTTATTDTPTETLIGDVDCNGSIEAPDLLLIKKHVLQMIEIEKGSQAYTNADIDGNGEILATDLLYLKKYILQIWDNFDEVR
jgi:hypothetical protein